MEYYEIKTEREAAIFDRETNSLHDGCLVSANYSHDGYIWGNPMVIDPQKASLTLRIMVTSLGNTLVELLFEAVREFQIKEADYELLASAVSFSADGLIIWCGDDSAEPDAFRDANYVIAEKMKWRLIV